MDSVEKKEPQQYDPNDSVGIARSITHQEFIEYFNSCEKKYGELACPMCRTSLWVVSPQDSGSTQPLMVTFPLPMVQGMGVWSFPIFCSECGYTVLYNATYVSRKIRGIK